jgi:hypothetical protein
MSRAYNPCTVRFGLLSTAFTVDIPESKEIRQKRYIRFPHATNHNILWFRKNSSHR